MSHNKFTVAGQSPNANSEISVALNNLSDVDTTGVAAGNVIAYNGSSYEASSSSISLGVVFLGEGASSNYPQTLNASDNVYFYAPNPVNTISATLLDSDGIGSNWYDGVTLNAGEYIISCSLHGDYTGSTGITTFIIKSGSTQIGCFAQDVDGANNSDYPSDASAYISLSSSTDIVVDITSVTAANSTKTDAQAKRGYLQIIKVG